MVLPADLLEDVEGGGLAAGMAVSILIGLWIYDELTFNKYHKNYDRIAQVMLTYFLPDNIGSSYCESG